MQKRKMGFDKSHSHFMRTKYDSQGVARIPCGINVEEIQILVRPINDGYIVISFVHTWLI